VKVAESKLRIPLSNLIKLVTGLNKSHCNVILSKYTACPPKNIILLLSFYLEKGTVESPYKNPSDPITIEFYFKENKTISFSDKLSMFLVVIFVIETFVSCS